MNSRERRKVQKRAAPILRALEGGYYDEVLGQAGGFTDRKVFAARTSELLGKPWKWPRGELRTLVAEGIVARKLGRARP